MPTCQGIIVAMCLMVGPLIQLTFFNTTTVLPKATSTVLACRMQPLQAFDPALGLFILLSAVCCLVHATVACRYLMCITGLVLSNHVMFLLNFVPKIAHD